MPRWARRVRPRGFGGCDLRFYYCLPHARMPCPAALQTRRARWPTSMLKGWRSNAWQCSSSERPRNSRRRRRSCDALKRRRPRSAPMASSWATRASRAPGARTGRRGSWPCARVQSHARRERRSVHQQTIPARDSSMRDAWTVCGRPLRMRPSSRTSPSPMNLSLRRRTSTGPICPPMGSTCSSLAIRRRGTASTGWPRRPLSGWRRSRAVRLDRRPGELANRGLTGLPWCLRQRHRPAGARAFIRATSCAVASPLRMTMNRRPSRVTS